MPNWLTTRGAVKRAAKLNGPDLDLLIDRVIDSASRRFEKESRRRFIPRTELHTFRWPPWQRARSWILWLDPHDLLSATLVQARAQDATPVTIVAADYFL